MKVIRCRDVGVDCEFEAHGETVDNVLSQCGEHARTAHGMSEISSELLEKVKSAIHEEGTATASGLTS
jgi:predicted small metal-binding protein